MYINFIYVDNQHRVVFLKYDHDFDAVVKKLGPDDCVFLFNAEDVAISNNNYLCKIVISPILDENKYIDVNILNLPAEFYFKYEGWHDWPVRFNRFDVLVKNNVKVSKVYDRDLHASIVKLEQFILESCEFIDPIIFSGYLNYIFIHKFLYETSWAQFNKLCSLSNYSYYYLDRPVNKQGNLLSGAKITSEGVVIDCDGKYDFRQENFDMLVWQSFENKDLVRDEYLKKLDSYVLNELKSDFLYLNLLSHFGRYVYGHFFDILSKSLRFKSLDNIVCLINDNPRNLINQLTRQLWLLGIRNIILVPPKTILHVPKLLNLPLQAYPSQISKEDQYLIYKKFTVGFTEFIKAPRLKIYLSRNANNPNLQMVGTRNVLNDIELIGYLKTKGFVVITGEEDLGYITEIFSRCIFLISIHGSGIRNMIFSNFANFILELYPSKFKTQNERVPDNTIANLCVSRNSVYKQLIIDSDEDFNMNVHIDAIRSYVELFD